MANPASPCMTDEDLAVLDAAANAVETYIKDNDYTTFVEVENVLKAHIPIRGNLCIELMPNVVVWMGMSQEFVDVIDELQQRKALIWVPAAPLTYLIDGSIPKMPLAVRPPKNGYAKPHWAPVCFRPRNKTLRRPVPA